MKDFSLLFNIHFIMLNVNMLSVIQNLFNNNNESFNIPDISRYKIKFSMEVYGTFIYTFCYFLPYEIDTICVEEIYFVILAL